MKGMCIISTTVRYFKVLLLGVLSKVGIHLVGKQRTGNRRWYRL